MKNPVIIDYAALLLRIALALMFFAHAWLKIKVFTPAGTVKYFESLGVPGFFAYLTMAAEIAGGTLLLLGIETRWVALLLVPLMAGTIVLVHGKNGWLFSNKDGGWEYPAFWIVGLLVLAALVTERSHSVRRSGCRRIVCDIGSGRNVGRLALALRWRCSMS